MQLQDLAPQRQVCATDAPAVVPWCSSVANLCQQRLHGLLVLTAGQQGTHTTNQQGSDVRRVLSGGFCRPLWLRACTYVRTADDMHAVHATQLRAVPQVDQRQMHPTAASFTSCT